MDRIRSRRAGLVLAAAGLGVVALAGCQSGSGTAAPASTGSSPASTAPAPGTASASASPGLSVPGTHRTTAAYQISTPVSTVVVVSHVGDVTVTGGTGTATSVVQEADYSKTPPVTTRTVSGGTLTLTYSCPTQLVCGVAYVLRVPRDVTIQATAGAGTVQLSGLAGHVTAQAKTGLIAASGLSGQAVSLTTDVGAINAAFASPPATLHAVARVGAITLTMPGGTSYQVTTDAHVGKATVSVPTSASAGHAITATTDVGAIRIATGA
jgi:hypothetical protein